MSQIRHRILWSGADLAYNCLEISTFLALTNLVGMRAEVYTHTLKYNTKYTKYSQMQIFILLNYIRL